MKDASQGVATNDTVPGNRHSSHSASKESTPSPHSPRWEPAIRRSTSEYAGMILQPDSSPISEEQLAAEIKGIYEGVVTVEIKCIDIDAALASDTKSQLGVEQWQALIALHRTLLYQHHDFLMATQHPSASDSLKALATKYSKQPNGHEDSRMHRARREMSEFLGPPCSASDTR